MDRRRGLAGQDLRAPLGAFRAAVIAVCALLSIQVARDEAALLVLLPLAVATWIAFRSAAFARAWPYLGALVATRRSRSRAVRPVRCCRTCWRRP